MPKFQVELGYWNPFMVSHEVEAKDPQDACVQARLAFKPGGWEPKEGDSQVFISNIVEKGTRNTKGCQKGDKNVSVPHEERESRVVMHMLADAVKAEDDEDGR